MDDAEDLEAFLAEGLASKMLSEEEFRESVNRRTEAILADYRAGWLKKSPKDTAS